MKDAFLLLYFLEESVPPEAGQHHSLEIRTTEAVSKPVVVIRRPGGRVTTLYLEGADFIADPKTVAVQVVEFLKELG